MAIAKKPIKTQDISEKKINAVIQKGGSVVKTKKDEKIQKILLRIPTDLNNKIEKSLNSRLLKTPRNTWILEAIFEKLEKEQS
jgi:hypothetical protein